VGIKTSKYDETQTLSLKSGFDNILKLWTKGHRYNTRKARKEGVLIRLAYNLHDWNNYYSVYEDSLRRWGNRASSKYGSGLFNKMFRCNSSDIKLWLATYQDNVVAGALCFYAKNHVVYWHGASLEKSFHLYPVNLLLYEVIKDACEQGYFWFDFNPSGGHEGVKSFKKGFGCSTLQSNLYFHDSNIKKMIHLIANLKY
jgi:lipid II:glycine glycyltransferase (peptidoglycan interpeptide bridge formation enzyme)